MGPCRRPPAGVRTPAGGVPAASPAAGGRRSVSSLTPGRPPATVLGLGVRDSAVGVPSGRFSAAPLPLRGKSDCRSVERDRNPREEGSAHGGSYRLRWPREAVGAIEQAVVG